MAAEIVLPTPFSEFSASAITGKVDGDLIDSWASTGTDTAAAGTTTQRPTYKTGVKNSLPAVRFASGCSLNAQWAATHGPVTLVTVHRLDTAPSRSSIVSGPNSSTIGFQYDLVSGNQYVYGWGALNQTSNGSMNGATSTDWAISVIEFGGANTRHNYNAVWGGSRTLTDGPAVAGFTMGANRARSGQYFTGDIAHNGWYDGVLSRVQVSELMKKLSDRYSIALV